MERLIFDAHAHYDDEKFDSDREALIESLPEKGVFAVVTNGTDYKTSLKSVELAEKYPYIYAAVGIHPESVPDMDCTMLDKYISEITPLLNNKKVVAIGEAGLDYYWDIPKKEQKLLFEAQLKLAADTKLPIIIHDREAHGDTVEYLRRYCPFEIGRAHV